MKAPTQHTVTCLRTSQLSSPSSGTTPGPARPQPACTRQALACCTCSTIVYFRSPLGLHMLLMPHEHCPCSPMKCSLRHAKVKWQMGPAACLILRKDVLQLPLLLCQQLHPESGCIFLQILDALGARDGEAIFSLQAKTSQSAPVCARLFPQSVVQIVVCAKLISERKLCLASKVLVGPSAGAAHPRVHPREGQLPRRAALRVRQRLHALQQRQVLLQGLLLEARHHLHPEVALAAHAASTLNSKPPHPEIAPPLMCVEACWQGWAAAACSARAAKKALPVEQPRARACLRLYGKGRGAHCRSAWDLMVPVRKPRPAAQHQELLHAGWDACHAGPPWHAGPCHCQRCRWATVPCGAAPHPGASRGRCRCPAHAASG